MDVSQSQEEHKGLPGRIRARSPKDRCHTQVISIVECNVFSIMHKSLEDLSDDTGT